MRKLSIALALLIVGCTSDRSGPPASPLPPDRFAAVYADLLLASIDIGRDSLASARRCDSVLATQSVTRDQFSATARWCDEKISRWDGVMEEVVRILEERSKKQGGKTASP